MGENKKAFPPLVGGRALREQIMHCVNNERVKMHAQQKYRIFTLQFSEELQNFADGELQEFLHTHAITAVSEQFFCYHERPYWTFFVRYTDAPPGKQRKLETELAPHDHGLYEKLRQWRNDRAKEESRAPYM